MHQKPFCFCRHCAAAGFAVPVATSLSVSLLSRNAAACSCKPECGCICQGEAADFILEGTISTLGDTGNAEMQIEAVLTKDDGAKVPNEFSVGTVIEVSRRTAGGTELEIDNHVWVPAYFDEINEMNRIYSPLLIQPDETVGCDRQPQVVLTLEETQLALTSEWDECRQLLEDNGLEEGTCPCDNNVHACTVVSPGHGSDASLCAILLAMLAMLLRIRRKEN